MNQENIRFLRENYVGIQPRHAFQEEGKIYSPKNKNPSKFIF